MKVLIFGAGIRGKRLYNELSNNNKYQILGFVDNNTALAGQKLCEVPVYSPDQIMSAEVKYDIIYIAIKNTDIIQAINTQLEIIGVPKEKIKIYRGDKTPDIGDRWNTYYNDAESTATSQVERFIVPIIDKYGIDMMKTLDFPSGRGRIAEALKKHYDDNIETIAVCDSNANAIEYCKNRFSGTNAEFYVNKLHDTKTFPLPIEDESFTFIYSWDAMVHFSYKWLDFYFSEFERLLKPGGFLFVHHSNYGAEDVYLPQPKSENWADNPGGRTPVSADDVKFIVGHYGFKIVEQKLIDWTIENQDCITVAVKI